MNIVLTLAEQNTNCFLVFDQPSAKCGFATLILRNLKYLFFLRWNPIPLHLPTMLFQVTVGSRIRTCVLVLLFYQTELFCFRRSGIRTHDTQRNETIYYFPLSVYPR